MSGRVLTKQFSPSSDYAPMAEGTGGEACVWWQEARGATARRAPRFQTRRCGDSGKPVTPDMIAFIDHSRHWNGRRTPVQEWIRLLEAYFRSYPERRPASGLEVFMLSCALDCPEASVELVRAGTSRLVPGRYVPNMPA